MTIMRSPRGVGSGRLSDTGRQDLPRKRHMHALTLVRKGLTAFRRSGDCLLFGLTMFFDSEKLGGGGVSNETPPPQIFAEAIRGA
ncbi:MAG: hypothetical protein C4519_26485 [Desulfobacteraceae bacterium]|nr:MAG: hypothetical protein C4519_26485 [Desulfobacteraceae bacterium]